MQISGVSFLHSIDSYPNQDQFILHNHSNYYELILFISGDAEFRAEGSVYSLNPYDLVLARNNELHRIVHKSFMPYERTVIKISTDFFVRNNCMGLEGIFTERHLGCDNLISSQVQKQYGISKLIHKIETYLTEENEIAASCVLIEMLSLLNKYCMSIKPTSKSQKHIREIIFYINTHLTEELTLTDIANHFYLNKQHLCRIFKEATGYTINQYISLKRLILATELEKSGKNKTTAAIEAGFATYSGFYKVRKKFSSML